jgi:cell division protein FtsB
MKLKASHVIIVLLLIILILGCILIFRKPTVIENNNQEELDRLTQENVILVDANKKLDKEVDSLYNNRDVITKTKEVIKHIYHDQINLVTTADSKQLDSIIRSNW